jgi:hypothetical protein
MFDLPRKVNEFSCMCCGERFWTTKGEASVFANPDARAAKREAAESGPGVLELTPIAHPN